MSTVNCQRCIDLLVDYLEGELPADMDKALDEHFLACPPCLDFLDQYRAASTLSRKALEQEIPEVLAVQLDEFLRNHCK